MATKKNPPFTRADAHDGAISFTALAAAEELVLFARYGDSVALVKPEDRDEYDAVRQVISSQRHAATMMRRYSQGLVEIGAVESSLSPVDAICAGVIPHLAGVFGDGWRDARLTADLRACLERCSLAPAALGAVGAGERLNHAQATSAGCDFIAIAGEREVTLYAQHGDCLASVEPSKQACWRETVAVVRAERDAGVTLLGFAAGRNPWSAVEIAVRSMDDRYCKSAYVAPGAIALSGQSVVAAALADLLDSVGLPVSAFYRSACRK